MKKGKIVIVFMLVFIVMLTACSTAANDSSGEKKESEKIEIVIESWRTDDIAVWEDVVLPAYMDRHPEVTVKFNATSNSEYGTTLTTKLQGGTAGDIIMVEPYDYRISLFKEGYLANIGEITTIDADTEHYDEFALSAWQTDEGELFGLPLAAVSHGFIYNKTKFKELGLEIPKTTDEFFSLCQQIEDAGYVALAMGSADEWVANVYGYSIVAPTFTKGEEGRQGLIKKTAKFTDEGFVNAWKFLDGWKEYMPDGYEGIGYSDMTTMFSTEQALMMSAGSWDVAVMAGLVGDSFEVGGFQTPVDKTGDKNYVCLHPDNALALNASSDSKEAAIEFLQWTTTKEFAKVWNDALPGFFTLSKHEVELENPLASEMFSWASKAEGASPRLAYQYISRGDFNTDSEISRLTTLMFLGELTPEEVAKQLQEGYDASYSPKGF